MEKRILVAPLDWGLGHASRSVSIINHCLNRGLDVFLASSGEAGLFLRREFPGLPYFDLPAYPINYHHPLGIAGGIIWQFPSIKKAIHQEHITSGEIIRRNKIDITLSDNRYGIWHPETYNILMIHQLGIRSPFAGVIINPALRTFHYQLIKPFDSCWVPDFPDENNLSGKLSHNIPLPRNTRFIGPLSRFSSFLSEGDKSTGGNTLLAILSGPEPHRSHFEGIIHDASFRLNIPLTMIRGKYHETDMPQKTVSLTKIPYLTSYQLYKEIQSASLIICRAGYSSIMDLFTTGKKALLIPTPGQTEQEYLANYHKEKGFYYSVPERKLNLAEDINTALQYKGLEYQPTDDLLDQAFKNIIC